MRLIRAQPHQLRYTGAMGESHFVEDRGGSGVWIKIRVELPDLV
jgi:hypothetical protein